jgi:ribokinase
VTAGAPRIAVVGSVNLDLVATAEHLPAPGETVTGASFARHPGGKGANQALAARRLGASVSLVACVGRDAAADEALALLRADGVDLSCCLVTNAAPTGVALIAVAADGENQIVVAPGANLLLQPGSFQLPAHDALICQLEIPLPSVTEAVTRSAGFVCVNLAPAADVDSVIFERADLLVVNETEAAFYGDALQRARGIVATTLGARGAVLHRSGALVARVAAPAVTPIDTTGAGDAFVAALTVALCRGEAADAALAFACAAGAAATLKPGAQPSLPGPQDVEALLGSR